MSPPQLSALGWTVALLVLLTCANVAGLQLSRGTERSREFAARLAIGASRSAVVHQLLTESLLLALAGGALGLFLAATVAPVLASRFPLTGTASQLNVPLDFAILGFTFALSILICLLFGLLPAWHTTKIDLLSAFKHASAASAANTFAVRFSPDKWRSPWDCSAPPGSLPSLSKASSLKRPASTASAS